MGLGLQWDPYAYQPSPGCMKIIKSRMDFCRPGFLRVMWGADCYCLGFRADGSPEFVWQKGFAPHREYLNKLYGILDYAQKRDIKVILGVWSPPIGIINNEADPRWNEITADLLNYLRRVKGYTCITMYDAINEPNGSWSGNKDYASWVALVDSLHAEFVKKGVSSKIYIIGPDTTGSTTWLYPFIWLDSTAHDVSGDIGAFDLHWYASDSEVYDDEIEQLLIKKRQVLVNDGPSIASRPCFLGECGLLTGQINIDQQPRVKTFGYGVMMADYVAQTARAGWMGATAWDLDDAMHPVRDAPTPPGPLTLKMWGFWNSQGAAMGHPGDFDVRPWFYTWSLMSRLFPRGSRIVETDEPNLPRFRAIAGTDQVHGSVNLSIMLVNNNYTPNRITIQSPNISSISLICYHYFNNDMPTDTDEMPIPIASYSHVNLERGFSIDMPSRGVIFLHGTEGK